MCIKLSVTRKSGGEVTQKMIVIMELESYFNFIMCLLIVIIVTILNTNNIPRNNRSSNIN